MSASDHKEKIIAMYKSGSTLNEVADSVGVTRERVRQLLRIWGISPESGGVRKRSSDRKNIAADLANKKSIEKNGCPLHVYKEIISNKNNGKSVRVTYSEQRRNARVRGIKWEFKFWTWWNFWQESGKWEQRGIHADEYAMSRYGDTGPYSPDNVYICTCRQNSSESRKKPCDKLWKDAQPLKINSTVPL